MTRASWRRRVGTVFTAAAAGVLFSAATAHASDKTVWVLDDSGYAFWIENGDTIEVCDKAADGWGVRGYIYRPNAGDPENGTVLIKASDPKYDTDCVAVSVNVSETIPLSIKVCNYQGAKIALCDYAAIPGR